MLREIYQIYNTPQKTGNKTLLDTSMLKHTTSINSEYQIYIQFLLDIWIVTANVELIYL
jgi:hypothetical protein